MPHYNYIEIGTADFRTFTEWATPGMNGIAVEPIKEYLDRIPNPAGITKINAAVSNIDGSLNIYYIPSQVIEQHGLPQWIRGCNSINVPHKTVVRFLTRKNIDLSIIQNREVPVISVATLLATHNVTSVHYFKVDTEGHDTVIVNALLDTPMRPAKIRFESNRLSDKSSVRTLCERLTLAGYSVKPGPKDTLAVLRA